MKKITLLLLICVFTSCKQEISQEIKNKIAKKEIFWTSRNKLITKSTNDMEFPIKNDFLTTEERTNRVYLRSSNCQFEVFVDDVLLFKLMGDVTQNGGGINGDYDINQLLLSSGKHEVKIRMYPKYGKQVFDKEGNVQMIFSYFKNRDLRTMNYNAEMNGHNGINIDQLTEQWIEKWDQQSQVGYEGVYVAKEPAPFKGLPAYEWRKTFDAEVPFSFEGWRNSVDLSKESKDEKKDINKELYDQYKLIHNIIKNKDANQYLNIVKEREELITNCLYYKDNEKKIRMDEFVKLIKSDEYELEPLYSETFKLEYQGYGKLSMLLNKTDGEGIIRLKNKKDKNDMIFLDFRFQRKKKGEKLTVI